jgi:DNA-binding beta-propeller fold protein YncE
MNPRARIWFLAASITAIGALAASARAQSLFWIDTNYGAPTINRADVNGVAQASLALGAGTLPEGIGVDATGRIYWGDGAWTGARLNTASNALAGVTPIVSGGSSFRGVAVDVIDQLIYSTTSNLIGGATVQRCTLAGTSVATLIALPAGANPRGIGIDHAAHKLYWADFDLNAVYQSNLDGTSVVAWMALPAGSGAYGVAVDAPNKRVYWTEYNGGNIKVANTNGTGLTTLYSGLSNPTYLALDPSSARMYWAEGGAGNQHIRRALMTPPPSTITTLPCPVTTYGGLAISTSATVSVSEPGPALPTGFALERPWPNPASSSIRLKFALPRDSRLRLSVFDLQGRELAVLADGVYAAGRHESLWDGRGPGGESMAGIYFARLVVAGRTLSRRIALAR